MRSHNLYRVTAWMAGTASLMWLAWSVIQGMPVRYVRIEGELHQLRLAEIRQVLAPLLTDYWGLDLMAIAQVVRDLPWVEQVKVERLWPDTLILGVKEQTPYLRWRETALLNPQGIRFSPPNLKGYDHLPLLTGPAGYERQMYRAYQEMQSSLRSLGWRIERLVVDDRGSWRLYLNGDLEMILGRQAPRQAFQTLLQAMERIGRPRLAGIRCLDGRYEHGFAVRWRRSSEDQRTAGTGQ